MSIITKLCFLMYRWARGSTETDVHKMDQFPLGKGKGVLLFTVVAISNIFNSFLLQLITYSISFLWTSSSSYNCYAPTMEIAPFPKSHCENISKSLTVPARKPHVLPCLPAQLLSLFIFIHSISHSQRQGFCLTLIIARWCWQYQHILSLSPASYSTIIWVCCNLLWFHINFSTWVWHLIFPLLFHLDCSGG